MAALSADAAPLICRVCWGEADDEPGRAPLEDPSLEANPDTRQPRPVPTLLRLTTLHNNPVINSYLLGAALSGMVHSVRGSLSSLGDVPRLFMEARKDPLAALAPQWPQLVLAGLGSRLARPPGAFYGSCGFIYLFGFYPDRAAWDMRKAISGLPLPYGVRNTLALPLWAVSALGMCVAAPPFALLWGLCGAQAGLARGVLSGYMQGSAGAHK
ncbi:hypothetical protein N2152v2_005375 [Parachlorella kessleri]